MIPTPQSNGRYFGSAISLYREEQFNANFDYRFSQNNLLSAKLFFSDSPETFERNGNVNVPGFPSENTGENLLVSIQDVFSFNANVVNEARIGYNFVRFSNTTQQPLRDSDFGINRLTAVEYPGLPIIRIAPNSGGTINPNTGRITESGDFGKIISTSNNPRLVQLALKLNF